MKSAANRKKEVAMKHLTNVKNFFLQDEEENNRDRASEEKSLLNNSDSPVVNKPQTRKKRSDVDDALKMLRERPTEYSDSEPESSDSDDGFANVGEYNPQSGDNRIRHHTAHSLGLQDQMQMEVKRQDDLLDDMVASLEKLGVMGQDIHKELRLQTELIAEVNEEMEATQDFVGALDRRLGSLIEESGWTPCKLIAILSCILLIMVVWIIN